MTVTELIQLLEIHKTRHGRGDWPVEFGVVGENSHSRPKLVFAMPDSYGEVVQILALKGRVTDFKKGTTP